MEQALEVLRRLPRDPEYVFPGRFGGMMRRDPSWLNGKIKLSVPGFNFKSLRHTFASRFLDAGGSLEDLCVVLGHSTVRQTERYGRLTQRYVGDRVRLLELNVPKFGGQTGTNPKVLIFSRRAKR